MMRLRKPRLDAAVALLLLCTGCAGQHPLAGQLLPYRQVSLADVTDDLPVQSLADAGRASLAYYERTGVDPGAVVLDNDRYDAKDLERSVRRVLELIEETPAGQLAARLAGECRAYAADEPARFTAYYEPLLAARRRPDARFRYPIYRAPDAAQRGLLIERFGRLPTRAEIDGQYGAVGAGGQRASERPAAGAGVGWRGAAHRRGDGAALRGLGLELAWLDDPVARFFLHVQGSGRLRFEDDSQLRVGFAASNDAPYRSVGAAMLARGLLAKDNASAPAMRTWLAAHPSQRDALLFENPRYVFFREVAAPGPIGALGVALVPGRSLATDPHFVARGILTFVRTRAPVVDRDGRLVGQRPLARFAFSHDVGAAIRGPARADIFWGSGETAGAEAGYLNEAGEFFVLVCGSGGNRSARRNSWTRR
ncbi:MAG: MltA domain-containing protein [Deltaproteobacteria bacterium]|nr:MltA domain-containing protein [Deltaproteobacteria bacterium]